MVGDLVDGVSPTYRHRVANPQVPPPHGRYRRLVTFEFSATLWMHQGEAAWHFVTLPEEVADEIRGWFETLPGWAGGPRSAPHPVRFTREAWWDRFRPPTGP